MGYSDKLPPPLYANPDARVYRVHMPHDRTVVAACEDVGCDSWRFGWETVCDESDEMQAVVAMAIRAGESGRTFTETAGTSDDGRKVAVFRFDSGQRCFAEHRTRPGRLLVHQGGRAREHASLADLAEDYTEHVGRVAEQEQRG